MRRRDQAADRRVDGLRVDHPRVEQIGAADEAGDEGIGRPIVDFVRRARLHEPALVQEHDAVGEGQGLILIVSDEECGDVLRALDAADLVSHGDARGGIERGEWLVQEQRAGAEDKRTRQRHALLLAAGELRRQPVGKPGEPDQLEHVRRTAAAFVRCDLAHAQRIRDVFPDTHVREQRVRLEHHAALARSGGKRAHVLAVQPDDAGVGPDEAGDEPQQRCLAAAAGTQTHHQLARRDVERDVGHAGLGAGIAVAHVFKRDRGHRG